VKIIICQPRRIAVVNLRNRLREQIGDKVGMRMGHGIKEDSPNTKVFFVTTGYLLRLIAYHPESMASTTHLIIDEVHERSVEGDILAWLAKKNLQAHPHLRVILMSATLHINLYRNYFSTFMPPSPRSDGGDDCLSGI
jgi:HrpA-like RNA helicase